MQDLTHTTTDPTDVTSTSGHPPTARSRLRAGALAMALALVTVGCSTATDTDDPDEAGAAADDAAAETAGDTDPADDNSSDASGVQRLEDVAGGGEFVELDPGLYTGDLMDGLVISVPAGVGVNFDEDGPIQNYFFEATDRDALAVVLPITGVVPPDRVGSPVATEDLDQVLTDVPDDLGTYFEAIPQLEVLDSGETGTYRWWDIQVRPELGDVHSECGPPGMECISLFGEPTGAVTLNTMTGWMPRVVQPIANPSVLIWAAGQDGTIGPGHELTLELAEGFE